MKRIYVSPPNIQTNGEDGGDRPVITVQTPEEVLYGHEAVIAGPSRVVYSKIRPAFVGARVWVETEAKVTVVDHRGDKVVVL